jgi:hypothetical protein
MFFPSALPISTLEVLAMSWLSWLIVALCAGAGLWASWPRRKDPYEDLPRNEHPYFNQ